MLGAEGSMFSDGELKQIELKIFDCCIFVYETKISFALKMKKMQLELERSLELFFQNFESSLHLSSMCCSYTSNVQRTFVAL